MAVTSRAVEELDRGPTRAQETESRAHASPRRLESQARAGGDPAGGSGPLSATRRGTRVPVIVVGSRDTGRSRANGAREHIRRAHSPRGDPGTVVPSFNALGAREVETVRRRSSVFGRVDDAQWSGSRVPRLPREAFGGSGSSGTSTRPSVAESCGAAVLARAYNRAAGVDVRWVVIDGDPAFFEITERSTSRTPPRRIRRDRRAQRHRAPAAGGPGRPRAAARPRRRGPRGRAARHARASSSPPTSAPDAPNQLVRLPAPVRERGRMNRVLPRRCQAPPPSIDALPRRTSRCRRC